MQQTEQAIMDHPGQLLAHHPQSDLTPGQSHSCTRQLGEGYPLGEFDVSTFWITAPQQSSFRFQTTDSRS